MFSKLFSRGNIRHKILTLVVGVSAISLIIFTVIAFVGVSRIQSIADESSSTLGGESASSSREALKNMAVKDLLSSANDKADLINANLMKIGDDLIYASNYIKNLYNDDVYRGLIGRAPTRPYLAIDDRFDGIPRLQYNVSEDLTDSEIDHILFLLRDAENIFSVIYGNNSEVAVIIYGTEAGVMLSYDDGDAPPPEALEGYDHRNRPWYIKAKEAGTMVWTDLYVDSGGRGHIITCAVPLYDNDGDFKGVVSMDVMLDDMNNTIVSAQVGAGGYAFLIDENGTLVSSPFYQDYEDTDFTKSGDSPEFITTVTQMLNRESGISELEYRGEDIFLAYAPLPLTSWSLGVALPVDEVMDPADEAAKHIAELTADARGKINTTILTLALIFFVLLCVMLAVVFYVSRLTSRKLTEPIYQLMDAVRVIGGGNLDHEFKIQTGDEIEELGDAFSAMTTDLKLYIENLTDVLSKQERLAGELSVATHIQASMLPRVFTPFPGRGEIDLYATMEPAKEVGGDFYDFFPVGKDNMCFVIADVSGKGVPAALFMVVSRTMLKNQAQFVQEPARILSDVNNYLCEGNDEDMFVTALLGNIDLKTGLVRYANGGHNAPVVIRADGSVDWLEVESGFMLAGYPDMEFVPQEIQLHPGDTLLLYTDGVTEAVNPALELYSDPRLLINCAKAPRDKELSELLGYIRRDIDEFGAGAEQADDITMLALRYNGGASAT